MKSALFFAGLAASTAVSGCSILTNGDPACTLQPVQAVSVRVEDSRSGTATASGSMIVVTRHGGAVDTVSVPSNSTLDAERFDFFDEAGAYDVSVNKPGFTAFTTTVTVRLTDDGCHPATQLVVAKLQPAPGTA